MVKNMKKLDRAVEKRIEDIIGALTLEQKAGQMTQTIAWGGDAEYYANRIRRGEIGTMICGVPDITPDRSAEANYRSLLNGYQKVAIEESPCHIPLMFGADVIHSYNVCYPVPLGSAASFDMELVERCYRDIAEAAARDGLNWTFAPVLDLAHDPRWGRSVESGGEDPLLAGALGAAIVRGFQGDLESGRDLIACAKHFIGYGAMEGGRDYHNSDISDYFMNNYYSHSFRSAVHAGALTVMSSFNSVAGKPVTASTKLLRDLLKGEMGFDGFVISDYDAVKQLETQGVAEDKREAARLASIGGVDMEMVDETYPAHLPELVRSGELDEAVLDEAVRRILRVKFAAGLFDRPFREDYSIDLDRHLADAREMCSENVVLLKNKDNVLPLKDDEKVFMAGPMLTDEIGHIGAWAGHSDIGLIKSYAAAARDMFPESCPITFSEARFIDKMYTDIPGDCKAIVLFLGEHFYSTGEAVSVNDLELSEDQVLLARTMHRSGIPVIGVINSGRIRSLGNIEEYLDAIVYGWHNGTAAAPGMLDVLFGRKSPSGRLPMTVPYCTGQVPVYYNALHPARDVDGYYGRDVSYWRGSAAGRSKPLYPFGYGLSYTKFEYGTPEIDVQEMSAADILDGGSFTVTCTVKNVGDVDSKEVVQCYVRDNVASMMRPMRSLAGFKKEMLAAGEEKTFTFTLGTRELGFYNENGDFVIEPGKFTVWVGDSSLTENKIEITVK